MRTGQLSARAISSSRPPSRHLSTTLPSSLSRRQVTSPRSKRPRVETPAPSSTGSQLSCRVLMRRFRTLTGNGRSVNRQMKMSATVYRSSSNSPNSGGDGERYLFSFGDFSKKAENHLKKSGMPKKMRNSAEKRKIDIPDTHTNIPTQTHTHTHTHTHNHWLSLADKNQ